MKRISFFPSAWKEAKGIRSTGALTRPVKLGRESAELGEQGSLAVLVQAPRAGSVEAFVPRGFFNRACIGNRRIKVNGKDVDSKSLRYVEHLDSAFWREDSVSRHLNQEERQ